MRLAARHLCFSYSLSSFTGLPAGQRVTPGGRCFPLNLPFLVRQRPARSGANSALHAMASSLPCTCPFRCRLRRQSPSCECMPSQRGSSLGKLMSGHSSPREGPTECETGRLQVAGALHARPFVSCTCRRVPTEPAAAVHLSTHRALTPRPEAASRPCAQVPWWLASRCAA